ncbi:hypothetical protein V8F20_006964 [Naviculisporaceae sp. PSN 640]
MRDQDTPQIDDFIVSGQQSDEFDLDDFVRQEQRSEEENWDRDQLHFVEPSLDDRILPLSDEIGERLELIARLEKYWQSSFTYLTRKPQYHFRKVLEVRQFKHGAITELLTALWQLPMILNLLLEIGTNKLFDSPEDQRHTSLSISQRSRLDNHKCVVLGTPTSAGQGNVCPILPLFSFPFSSNRAAVVDKVDWLWPALGRAVPAFLLLDSRYEKLIVGDGYGRDIHAKVKAILEIYISLPESKFLNRSWNLISLDDQLVERWWGGDLTFKLLGVKNDRHGLVSAKLQLHWLPQMTHEKDLKPHERNISSWFSQFDRTTAMPEATIHNPKTGQPLKTGDVFYMKVSKRTSQDMRYALDLRWGLLRLAALAGGIDAVKRHATPGDFFNDMGYFIALSPQGAKPAELEGFLRELYINGPEPVQDQQHALPQVAQGTQKASESRESI